MEYKQHTQRIRLLKENRRKLEGCCGVSADEYSCARGAQINFGDLTPFLTYGRR
jgi:hypothetical protein